MGRSNKRKLKESLPVYNVKVLLQDDGINGSKTNKMTKIHLQKVLFLIFRTYSSAKFVPSVKFQWAQSPVSDFPSDTLFNKVSNYHQNKNLRKITFIFCSLLKGDRRSDTFVAHVF